MMFRTITIAALVGFVSASSSYSIGCMSTLMAIGQNSDARTCLKPAQLLPVLVGAGNGAESVISYLDTWLGSMCGSPACSDATLSAVISNLTAGCSDEFGLDSSKAQQTIALVKSSYQTVRKIACLKDSNSGGINCVTGTLRNIEAITGAMSLNDTDIVSIASYVKKGFPSSIVCTNCMKGAYTILNQTMPGSFSASDTKYATDLCGVSFADGGIPPGLVSSAFTASAKSVTTASTTSTSTTSTTTRSTSTSTSTPTPTVTPTPTPTPTKKSSALGRGSTLSSGAFVALSGLVAFGVGLV